MQALEDVYPFEKLLTVNWPSQNEWRNKDQAGVNLFELYFNPNRTADENCFVKTPHVSPYGIYEDLNFNELRPYIQNYFAPSNIVRERMQQLIQKYGIDYEHTIGLCYRATDKWIEVAQIQPGYYLREAKRLLAKDANLRVFVQTDQAQVRELCIRELGDRSFYLAEMPVTASTIGIHNIPESDRGVSNFELGLRVLAVANILAKCKYLITHTGSMGLWMYLFRGTARNACQLRPGAPDIFSRFDGEVGIKRATLKLLRKLVIND